MENQEEIWIEMFDFPNYEISNLGNIRRLKTKKQIKLSTEGKTYNMASLWYNKKGYNKRVGRYVWMSFNNQFCSATIDHINGNPTDDRIENLRCISMEDNRAARKKYDRKNKYNLTKRDKGYIHYSITNKLETTWTIMKKYGIPLNYLGTTMKRNTWERYLPYYEV
jgi:hypothetical protein